ncbi:hypothetical protein ACE193_00480 [Bernardetia sp. OM2101]|uniref:hypothetical protein n=1 Tax=Bernardetia sp. OM2101 TaxID=3344876 RepID=UPI0035D113C7
MGMYYSIEVKNNNELGYIDFPESLSYFFEQVDAYEQKSISHQIEKILNIDLSLFQKTYHPEMESNERTNDFWIDIEELLNKLMEFKSKMKTNKSYFSKVLLNPKDDREKYINLSSEKIVNYQKENPLSLYPINNGIITEEILMDSIIKLIMTLKKLKDKGEKKIRLVYS